jgi:molybdopterin-guanine dinucleotide biosynthesis protein A
MAFGTFKDGSSLKYSAIILSGGTSKRFKQDKGLFRVNQKPLISYVIEAVTPLVNEVLIATSDDKVAEYSTHFPSLKIVADEYAFKAAISGALTGFKNASGDYSLLLPCDTPLVSQKVLALLLDLAPSNDAVIPRWPHGHIEPLQAIYNTKSAYDLATRIIADRKLKMSELVSRLPKVHYLPTSVIHQVDPLFLTFHNINTLSDLNEIMTYLH